VNVEASASAADGQWNISNLIRFFAPGGFAEKIGGWAKLCNTAVLGVCRALHYWVDLSSIRWFAAGTNSNLYVESSGALTSITPAGWPGGAASSGAVPYSLLIWSLDNFGENLLACPSGGGIYNWVPPDTAVPAAIIATAPAANQGVFVSASQQIAIAFGATPLGGSEMDPMLVRWSDQSDDTDWIPSTTNQAGSFRLSRGSRIVSGLSAQLSNFIWTDLDLWQMQYIGFPLVYGFIPVGLQCGLLAQNAVVVLGETVYWMSDHGFFVYSGSGVTPIPCSVWDVVYKNLDDANADKCVTLSNFLFNEIWFFYPSLSGGTGEIDSYVKYNIVTQAWDYGSLIRTAGTDANKPSGPVWVDQNGYLQQHENGVDADGEAMTGVLIRSGYTHLSQGQDFLFIDSFIPDFLWTNSTANPPSVTVTLYFRNWPGDTPTTEGPFTVTPTTEYITFRTRAREVAIEVECSALGVWFRLGLPFLRTQPAGRV
jgi:hypothetical protein